MIPLDMIDKFFPAGTKRRILLDETYRKYAGLRCAVRERLCLDRTMEVLEKEIVPFSLPVFEEPLVTIVIPVYNKFEYTYTCLKSVMEKTSGVDYEVAVVDNASTDATKDINDIVANVKVVRNEENLGFVEACNAGARVAAGKYILFLNNDTKVRKGWLKALVDTAESDPTVGIVGSKLIFPDGTLQEAGGIVWNNEQNLAWNFGREKNPNSYEFNYLKEADYCSAASVLVRKDFFDKAGGFDTLYAPAYCEDTDLAFTARKLGYRVLYQPMSEVVHFEGGTAGRNTSEGMKQYQVVNMVKFYEKWQGVLEDSHFKDAKDVFLARDRSKGRKVILFVDHYVPTHDKDAGSLSTYMYLKLLVGMGYKVVFVPDNLINIEPYTTELQQMGIEVLYNPVNFHKWIKKNGRFFHCVILARPHVAKKYLPLVRRYSDAKVLYNMHDLHYLREMRRYEVEKKKEILKDIERWRKIENHILEQADTILTFSEEEVRFVCEESPEVDIVKIPLFFYDEFPAENGVRPFDKRKDVAFLGGFGHPPNADAVKFFIAEIFPLIKKELPDVRFHIAGSTPPDEIVSMASADIVVHGFVKNLDDLFGDIRVFVSPLRFGAGVKGKIVTSLSYGVPVVTTSIGNEGLNLTDGVNGMISDDPAEFARKVVELYTHEKLWQKMSESAVRFVKDNFSRDTAEKIVRELTA